METPFESNRKMPLSANFEAVFPYRERQRRLSMGAEARSTGHGGIRMVAQAAGVRDATVSLEGSELDFGQGRLGHARSAPEMPTGKPRTVSGVAIGAHGSSGSSAVGGVPGTPLCVGGR